MKIVVISGSMRNDSQSLNVSNYLASQLKKLGVEFDLVDLNKQRLTLYDDTSDGAWKKVWQTIESTLDKADGFVLVTPEWDGMFSAGLHNLFNYVASGSKKGVMAHKPAMLVGVSTGMGGVYPLAQLRMTGPKNTHFVVSPENLRFSNVKEVLVDGVVVVAGVKERTDYSLKVLIEYAKALGQVRDSGVVDLEKFGSGV